MLLRRNLFLALVITAFLFLLFASRRVHKKSPPILTLFPNTRWASPNSRKTVVEPMAPRDDLTPVPPRTPSLPSHAVTEAKEEHLDIAQNDLRSCRCSKPCISDLKSSDWFGQRYDPKQQPVLQNAQTKLDPVALKWWLSLQQSGDDQTLEKVISEMFQVISPPRVDFRPSCLSCAVVGNSGNLLQSRRGKLINQHNYVIRMNKAVTKGFEEDVGNWTTHHFLYPESAVDVKNGVRLVLLPFKLKDLEWLTSALSTGQVKMTYMRVKERVEADKDKVLVVNPVFLKYVHDYWTKGRGRYPSTGILAIIFALHICDQVSVFGYGADEKGNWHHYWEKNPNAGAFKKTGVHNAVFEEQVIHQLAKEGKITLHL